MPHIPMEYTVDLGNTINVTPLHTLFAMGDDNAHRFAFNVVQGGNPVDLSGCTVLATYTNFTPNGVTVNLEGKIEDGKAVALLKKECYTMEGRFALVVRIKNSVGTSAIFYGDGYMCRTTADTVIDGNYIIYDVNTLLEKIAEINSATDAANKATANANTSAQNAKAAADTAITEAGNANKAAEAANTAAENWDSSYAADSAKLGGKSPAEYASAAEVSQLKNDIGDAWTSGKTYAVGDYCISGNRLYKCKTAHTAGSAFSADYWDAVNVTGEIGKLRLRTKIVDIGGVKINEGNGDYKYKIVFNNLPAGAIPIGFTTGPSWTEGLHIYITNQGYIGLSYPKEITLPNERYINIFYYMEG